MLGTNNMWSNDMIDARVERIESSPSPSIYTGRRNVRSRPLENSANILIDQTLRNFPIDRSLSTTSPRCYSTHLKKTCVFDSSV